VLTNTVLPQGQITDNCIKIGQFSFRGDLSLLKNGYCDFRDRWIPGLITDASYRRPAPQHIIGNVVWYNPGVMESVAQGKNIDLASYVDGIALMSVGDVGQTVWLKRPGGSWEGPFIVIDCSAQYHMFSSVYYGGEVAEIGFKTAERWGMVHLTPEGKIDTSSIQWNLNDVEVFKGGSPPDAQSQPVHYVSWWKEQTKFTNGLGFPEIMNH
jgi:hypothetical protein